MRNSIEHHYFSEGISTEPQGGSNDTVIDEGIPARFEFSITIPPPPDSEGSFGYTSVDVDKGREERGIEMSFSSGSRLQVDSRAPGSDRVTVMALRVCVATEDGERHEDGLVELLVGEGSQRLRQLGLFEDMDLRVTPHAAYEGVWVVDLGSVNISVDWLELESDFELLIESAALED